MVGIRTLEDTFICLDGLTGIGSEYVPRFEWTPQRRRFFRKSTEGRRSRYVHLVERPNYEWRDDHVLSRDCLRSPSTAAYKYGSPMRSFADAFVRTVNPT